eukprot:7986097-Pyramimonas_sp.AAC.2
MSSRAAVGTFTAVTALTVVGIWAIHNEQTEEKKVRSRQPYQLNSLLVRALQRLHAGVIRDRELLALKQKQGFEIGKAPQQGAPKIS